MIWAAAGRRAPARAPKCAATAGAGGGTQKCPLLPGGAVPISSPPYNHAHVWNAYMRQGLHFEMPRDDGARMSARLNRRDLGATPEEGTACSHATTPQQLRRQGSTAAGRPAAPRLPAAAAARCPGTVRAPPAGSGRSAARAARTAPCAAADAMRRTQWAPGRAPTPHETGVLTGETRAVVCVYVIISFLPDVCVLDGVHVCHMGDAYDAPHHAGAHEADRVEPELRQEALLGCLQE